ncbi:MAG: autotransporter-associated beta strand repeat-containing protein, partial [Chthoniobacterales bacterium]
MKSTLTLTMLLIGGLSADVQAQTLNDWISNDLMIGFRASGGTGSSDSYLVNVGSATNYNTNRSALTLSLGGIGTDLAFKYGSDWYSRSDLFWGIFGTTTNTAPTLYSSVARSDSNVQSTPPPSVTNPTIRNITASEITSVTADFNTLSPAANSTNAAFQPNSADPSSYNYQVTLDGTDFGTASQWNDIQGNPNQILDLYGQNNSGTFWRGGFFIDSTGTIAFSPTITPSPSPTPSPTPSPAAASYVWTNTSGSWSQAANWSNTVPSNGVSAVFAGSGGNSTNDIAGLSLASLTFSNTAGSYTLSGSNLVVGGIVNNSSSNQIISLGLGFTTNVTVNAASGSLGLTGNVALSNGAVLTLNGNNNTTISGPVAGNGSLTKSGSGTATLSGSNSFSGSVAVTAGRLGLASGNAISSSNAVSVSGGELSVDTNNTAASLTITSGLVSGNGTLTAATYALNGGTVSGNLGTGALTVGGNSTLSGTAASTNVTIGSGSLTLATNNSLAANASVVISDNATLNLGSSSQTLAAVTGNGRVTNNNGSLTLNASTNSSFGGSFTGTGTLTKSGAGTVTWSGDSLAYAGSTLLTNGGIALNGRLGGTLTVTNSGSLSGSGTLSSVTVAGGGSINPGNSPGTLTVSNSLSLNTGGILNWEINNWTGTAGTGWDLIEAGTLNIGATQGNTFVINVVSDNLSNFTNNAKSFQFLTYTNSPSFNADAFTVNYSSFAPLNTNATGIWTVTSSNNSLWLNYTNPPAVPFVWATNSGSWSTTNNWTNNASPSNTASVIFAGASGGNSTNDISNLRLTS